MPLQQNAPPTPSFSMTPAQNTPLLHLSDIIHTMSPSPEDERERERSGSATPRGVSPEPASEHEALAIRHRLQEMGLWKPIVADNLSSREKELVDMITRLVDPLPIDPAQLTRQAETIAALSAQRDYVLRQAADDRERWKYERETWDRTAEALLAQKASEPTRAEETNAREKQIHDMEVRSLEHRLAEAQRRQSALESELRTLKPLLFIQPYFIPRVDKGKGKAREAPISSSNHLEAATNADTPASTVPTASSSKLPPRIVPYHSSTHVHTHAHRASSSSRWWPSAGGKDKRKPGSRSSIKAGTSLGTDAYSEHLLLAMRRVGRTRTAEVSGIIAHAERVNRRFAAREMRRGERQQQHQQARTGSKVASGARAGVSGTSASRGRGGGAARDRHHDPDHDHDDADDADSPHGRPPPPIPPRTPARSTVVHYGPRTTRDNKVNTPIVFVHHVRSSNGTPGASASASARVQASTPTATRWKEPLAGASGLEQMQYTPVASHHQQSGPPTPLDSLIDAARSMMGKGRRARRRDTDVESEEDVDDDEGDRGGQSIRGRGSPVPNRVTNSSSKRRRLDATGAGGTRTGSGSGVKLDRPRSALDVLADQAAAAFDFNEKSERIDEGDSEGEDDEDTHLHPNRQTQQRGRGRGRLRGSRSASSAKSSTSTSTTLAVAVADATPSVSASGRPIRQSRKVGQAQQAVTGTGKGRGTSRPRGRPRGTASAKTALAMSLPRAASVSRVIMPPAPRTTRGGLLAEQGRDEGEDTGKEEESLRRSTTTEGAAVSSIASEVLRHGFADATRLRMASPTGPSNVSVRVHDQLAKVASAPTSVSRDAEGIGMRRVDNDTATAGAILAQPPPTLVPVLVPMIAADPPNIPRDLMMNTTPRPTQTLASGNVGVSSISDLPRPILPSTHPPPQKSHSAVSAMVAAEVHRAPHALSRTSVTRPSNIARGAEAPHPDAEAQAHAALDIDAITTVVTAGGEPEATHVDKVDADRALDAEAEARHNLLRGATRQGQLHVPSDPPMPHRAGQGQGGDNGHGNGGARRNGIRADDGHSHDGDADGAMYDVDADGEMEVDDPAGDAQV